MCFRFNHQAVAEHEIVTKVMIIDQPLQPRELVWSSPWNGADTRWRATTSSTYRLGSITCTPSREKPAEEFETRIKVPSRRVGRRDPSFFDRRSAKSNLTGTMWQAETLRSSPPVYLDVDEVGMKSVHGRTAPSSGLLVERNAGDHSSNERCARASITTCAVSSTVREGTPVIRNMAAAIRKKKLKRVMTFLVLFLERDFLDSERKRKMTIKINLMYLYTGVLV